MPMTVYSDVNNKNSMSPYCSWAVIQLSGMLARADMKVAPSQEAAEDTLTENKVLTLPFQDKL